MTLVRRALRRRFRDVIRQADTVAEDRVYDDRQRVHSRKGQIPAVLVAFGGEVAEVSVRPAKVYDRTMALWLDLYVRRQEDGEVLLDLADELAEEVQNAVDRALAGIDDLPGDEEGILPGVQLMADTSVYRETQFDFDGFGQTLEAGLRLVYDLTYRRPVVGSPADQQLREFLRVGLTQDHGGGSLGSTFEVRES